MVFVKRFSFHGREYYALAESVREGEKVRTRILRKLGPLSDVEAAWWRAIFSTPLNDVPKQFVNLDSFACLRSFRHGVPALAHALYSNLGFRAIIFECSLEGAQPLPRLEAHSDDGEQARRPVQQARAPRVAPSDVSSLHP